MNYYTVDKIVQDGDKFTGYLGEVPVSVRRLRSDDDLKELEAQGYGKCNAPFWHGAEFIINESEYDDAYHKFLESRGARSINDAD